MQSTKFISDEKLEALMKKLLKSQNNMNETAVFNNIDTSDISYNDILSILSEVRFYRSNNGVEIKHDDSTIKLDKKRYMEKPSYVIAFRLEDIVDLNNYCLKFQEQIPNIKLKGLYFKQGANSILDKNITCYLLTPYGGIVGNLADYVLMNDAGEISICDENEFQFNWDKTDKHNVYKSILRTVKVIYFNKELDVDDLPKCVVDKIHSVYPSKHAAKNIIFDMLDGRYVIGFGDYIVVYDISNKIMLCSKDEFDAKFDCIE